MNIFKTRYRIRFNDDNWMYVVQFRDWWMFWWSDYGQAFSHQQAERFIPDDGVIVGQ